jgi:uncharacterized protein
VIVYLDASALVKRFVAEAGSDEVATLIERADAVGTVVLSRAEVAAALAEAQRMKVVPREGAEAALWQDMLGEEITVATYDRQLWDAARAAGLVAWPARAGSARDG